MSITAHRYGTPNHLSDALIWRAGNSARPMARCDRRAAVIARRSPKGAERGNLSYLTKLRNRVTAKAVASGLGKLHRRVINRLESIRLMLAPRLWPMV